MREGNQTEEKLNIFRVDFLQEKGKNSHFCIHNAHIIRVLYLKVCTMSARCPHDRCCEGVLFFKKRSEFFEEKLNIFYLHSGSGYYMQIYFIDLRKMRIFAAHLEHSVLTRNFNKTNNNNFAI